MTGLNTTAPVPEAAAASRRWLRTDLATVIFHWSIAALISINLLTGLRVASDAQDASWSLMLSGGLATGVVIVWHVLLAWALVAAIAGYVVFLFVSRLHPRVAMDAGRLLALHSHDRRTRWQSINVLVYWCCFVLVGMAATSGTVLYTGPTPEVQAAASLIHRIAAWGIVAYIVAHVAAQWAMSGVSGLLKIVTPRMAYGGASAIAMVAITGAAVLAYGLDQATIRPLRLQRVASPPRLDGISGDIFWRSVKPVEIHTARGANQPAGGISVLVRAVYDGTHAHFLFEWPDDTRSQKHLPLRKTEQGWEVLQRDYARQDEDDFYEDKFAVMLSSASRQAALETSHLGERPLADRPGSPGGRGLHYTTDGSIVDVWHWKSVRTAPFAQIDDNFFGAPMPATRPGERYTGGYAQDPKVSGGFVQNWKAAADGTTVVPLWLPKTPALLERLGPVSLDAGVSDVGEWWLPKELVVPYSPEHDARFPVGSILPSVVIEGPFEGDRGDVRAVAKWDRGWWRLEVSRKLDTGSPFDVPIGTGTYLWVSVFNHSQTRHSYHVHPVRLHLE